MASTVGSRRQEVERRAVLFVGNPTKEFFPAGPSWRAIHPSLWEEYNAICSPDLLDECDVRWICADLTLSEVAKLTAVFPNLVHLYDRQNQTGEQTQTAVIWEWLLLPLEVMRSGVYDVEFTPLTDFVRALTDSDESNVAQRDRIQSAYIIVGGLDMSSDYGVQLQNLAIDGVKVNAQSYVAAIQELSRTTVVWPDVCEMLRRGEKRPLPKGGLSEGIWIGPPFLDILQEVARGTRTPYVPRSAISLHSAALHGSVADDEVLRRSYSDGRQNVRLPCEYCDYDSFARDRVDHGFQGAWIREKYIPSFDKLGTYRCYISFGEIQRVVRTTHCRDGVPEHDRCEPSRFDIEISSADVLPSEIRAVWSSPDLFLDSLRSFVLVTYQGLCKRLERESRISDVRFFCCMNVGLIPDAAGVMNFFVHDVTSSWGEHLFGRYNRGSLDTLMSRMCAGIPAYVEGKRQSA